MPRQKNPLIAGPTRPFNRDIPIALSDVVVQRQVADVPGHTLDLITAEALFAWIRLDKCKIDRLHSEYLEWARKQKGSEYIAVNGVSAASSTMGKRKDSGSR